MRPKVLICDEMVSALDVSVQAQILNLVEDLKASYGLTVLFIAHDLAVVKNVSDRVAVMYLGRLCEVAPADELYRSPRHPYTDALLASAVEPDPEAARSSEHPSGRAAEPAQPAVRVPVPDAVPLRPGPCATEVPELRELEPGHAVACHFPLESAGPRSATA